MPVLYAEGLTVAGKALILDKDGVLIDFHRVWRGITEHRVRAACALSGRWDREHQWLEWLGLSSGRVKPDGILAVGTRQEALTTLAAAMHQGGVAWPIARNWATQAFDYADRAARRYEQDNWLEGVADALRGLQAQGWKLAIATTDVTASAMRDLNVVGFSETDIVVVGADRVRHPKPAPDMVQLACQDLGVSPSDSVLIGDTATDLQMGLAAGVKACIGVRSGVGSSDDLKPWADALLDGVWQLDPFRQHPVLPVEKASE